ncbi:hypothetical protein CKM354_000446800 [Cercospora kikuchii]|uniref:Fucose-specific lectin n=1 Tax=Cercospora kikuchii TaxID=84275 RepID=A0A9P3CE69_9PEZI|nr:uncharacterized protein CKM354_000446800 [Cercospora kikuchii]GIZ41153.1 hypothetical protein CKM354_000446800 [Cercospora kikuchii]
MQMDKQNRDMEGLQPVQIESYPEAVDWNHNQRSNSVRAPEPLISELRPNEEKQLAYIESSTLVCSDREAGYPAGALQSDPTPLEFGQHTRPESKLCGLSKRTFVIAVALLAVIILAAVLGGVLGTVLKGNSQEHDSDNTTQPNTNQPAENTNQPADNTNEPSQKSHSPVDKTGFALLTPAIGTSTFAYYSTDDGLVEVEYKMGLFANASVTPVKITNNAKPTSPLAAVEITPPGLSLYRIVFYLDNDNRLNFVNTTLNSNWSEPYIVFEDMTAEPNTRALSAIAGSGGYDALSGIRVYFGSSNDTIQEVGIHFGEAIGGDLVGQWYKWSAFSGTDSTAGVASVLVDGESHVYMRNRSTGSLLRYVWSYALDDTKWDQEGIDASTIEEVHTGGSIAATSIRARADYIFYHTSSVGGATVAALCSGSSCVNVAPEKKGLARTAVGYSLAATADNEIAFVVNQDELDSSNMLCTSVKRGGVTDSTILST